MIIKEKILISLPVLYGDLIYNNLTPECRSRAEFIIKAIEGKFEKDKINYKPKIISEPLDGDIEDMPI